MLTILSPGLIARQALTDPESQPPSQSPSEALEFLSFPRDEQDPGESGGGWEWGTGRGGARGVQRPVPLRSVFRKHPGHFGFGSAGRKVLVSAQFPVGRRMISNSSQRLGRQPAVLDGQKVKFECGEWESGSSARLS